jgi:ABC-2 type transport system permease protein
VGYLLWTFTLSAYNGLSFGLMEEAQTGTLEQVFLTPYGPIPLFLVRNLAGLLSQGLLVFLVALTLMTLTGARLAFAPGGDPPLPGGPFGRLRPGLRHGLPGPPLQACGPAPGAFPVPPPLSSYKPQAKGAFLLLPLAPGAALAREMLATGTPLEPLGLLLAFLNSLAYFLLGLFLFRLAARRARRLGLLHGY